MRISVLFAIAVYSQLTTVWCIVLKGPLDDYIINVLECIRKEMNQGAPEHGVPHFNPLLLEELEIDVASVGIEGASGFLHLEDLELYGTTQWELRKIIGRIGFFPPSYNVKITINFPKLILKTRYSAQCTVTTTDPRNIYGNGTLQFEDNNFQVDLHAVTHLWGGTSLKYLNLHFSTDPLTKFDITGLFEDEQFSANLSEHILTDGVLIVERFSQKANSIIRNFMTSSWNTNSYSNSISDTTAKSEFNIFKYVLTKCKA